MREKIKIATKDTTYPLWPKKHQLNYISKFLSNKSLHLVKNIYEMIWGEY